MLVVPEDGLPAVAPVQEVMDRNLALDPMLASPARSSLGRPGMERVRTDTFGSGGGGRRRRHGTPCQ
jgi:hypothetical protein